MFLFCRWRYIRFVRVFRWVWWCEFWSVCLFFYSIFCCFNWWGNCLLILLFLYCKLRISDVKWMIRLINIRFCIMYINLFNWHLNIDSFFFNICSVEMIRLVNSFFINWDNKMYYEKINMSVKVRIIIFNEEFG